MNDIPIGLLLFLVILLLLSAFFSSMETAFSSANKIRLKNYSEEGKPGAKKAYYITQHFDYALSTILIGNNLVNIAAATISAAIASQLYGESAGLVISTVVMTILVLIFGEVLPKSFAKENAESLALKISGILVFLMSTFKPLTWVLVQLKVYLSSLVTSKESTPSITEQELKEMINISEEEGVIEDHERELVQNSLDFNDIRVGEILTPRTNIVAIEASSSVQDIQVLLLEERYSRVPVYQDTIDNIIGILSERDFLRNKVRYEEFDITELVRKPMFIYESMRISRLLPELQKNHSHMAIVIDEFGGTSGLITLEDILEELVGEIWDEHDEEHNDIKQIEENVYEFNGDFPLDEFAEVVDIPIPTSMYQTLGGWLVEEFQRFPVAEDQLKYGKLTLIVTEADDRRIRKVKVVVEG
ncbi:hemolysin family protein [Bacillus alkalicellulosilyticus]|uniref:hemolysin family protein n=1 Tax=Alkalihalobacterium alkalicellulosilyticum TaxID=1912214 RepID=UPI0009982C55|nr:hemolysin family protein [Bacillus alkalicellulosilyticus]